MLSLYIGRTLGFSYEKVRNCGKAATQSCAGWTLREDLFTWCCKKKSSSLPCVSETILNVRPACSGTSSSNRQSPQLCGRWTTAGGKCWKLYFLSPYVVYLRLTVRWGVRALSRRWWYQVIINTEIKFQPLCIISDLIIFALINIT